MKNVERKRQVKISLARGYDAQSVNIERMSE